ncbi:Major facilitator superfamily transporter [Cordyceps militaris]|uniref:Major facilitator superfamily transporter n=1 Tax=Cordyceps militaris TaxID=73501 RepID=A0A2H4SQT0_CORMI|nr:Major facilitator superfamily transporter [Cordyceps militaris]
MVLQSSGGDATTQNSEKGSPDTPPPSTAPAGAAPPPDGGLTAWLQVLAGHLIVFNTWGSIISFGIFQPYYEQVLALDPSAVSWIGSVQICLVLLVGAFSGRLYDAGYFRPMLVAGALLQLVGIFSASAATGYWQLLLSQGVCQGLGCGVIFAPTVANTAVYFARRRSLAISASACGGATGGIVFPLIARTLLHRVGFAWTLRVMGFVVLAVYAVVLLCVRTRLAPRKAGAFIDTTAFQEATYVLFAMSMFITLWATYFVYFYARAYAVNVLKGSQDDSFNMLIVINAVGIPGRLIPAYLGDRYFGAVNVFLPTVFSMAVCVFAWVGVRSIRDEYIWIIFLGYFGAGIQGLFPSTLAGLTKDLSKSGTRIGMIFSVVSIAALTGPPLAGKLIDVRGGMYLGAQLWGGACLVVGGLILAAAKLCNTKEAT